MAQLRRNRRSLAKLEALAQTIANGQPEPNPRAPYRGRRLMEDMLILQLKERGMRNADIAKLLGKHLGTIYRRLAMSTVTRQMLTSMLPDFAHDWKTASTNAALQGDHRPAMDAIAAVTDIQVVKKHVGDQPKYQLQIGINLAGETHTIAGEATVARLPEATP